VKTTPKRNDAFQIRPRQKAERKRRSKEKQIHSQRKATRKEDSKTLPEQKAFVIREIKLTHSKNGRH